MNKFFMGLAVSLGIIAVFLVFTNRESEVIEPVAVELPPSAKPQAEITPPPAIQFPVPETASPAPRPLPALDESDEPVQQEIEDLVSDTQLSELLLFKTFIRNFVVIVDNLTARLLPQQYYFFQPPPGKFTVIESEDGSLFMDSANFSRYAAFIRLVDSLDLVRLTEIYVFLYPLLQEAYGELGYPDRYFNDRLIEVINTILATPEIQGPVELVQPTVYYKFARPELEALTSGQKLLIRIGPDNARIVRARLTELRNRLTALNNVGQ